ncbi:alpha/beta hydrolase [Occallatibacter savannae]|uniref:alpha/beta hydrolase n=1 Tax=Occallatibacter savannae TaxID=1002691 RepID=UPI0013A5B230|nr:alpha/beta fold hydrolase [Occallatibacter savannae]
MRLAQRIAFTTSLTIASRFIQLRDRLLGRIPRSYPACPSLRTTRHTLSSGKNLLDAIFVEPEASPPRSALLICHGIGETAPQWFPIQRIFAESGIASLVFDYSGYGRSTGHPDFHQFEQDAVSSFAFLQRLAPGTPITLLGFSLGTGIAPAILNRVTPDRLILCAGYTSFRKAARAAWIPPFMTPLVPPIWSAREALCDSTLPILIVHGDRDRLFPAHMAHELHACTNHRADFLTLPARTHNSPFYKPQPEYWNPIISWLLSRP